MQHQTGVRRMKSETQNQTINVSLINVNQTKPTFLCKCKIQDKIFTDEIMTTTANQNRMNQVNCKLVLYSILFIVYYMLLKFPEAVKTAMCVWESERQKHVHGLMERKLVHATIF